MPGYTSYSIDYEKIAKEQSDAMEKANRYFSTLIEENPDGFFESENNFNGVHKSNIQDIRYKNNLKACLLYLYDKNRKKTDESSEVGFILFKLLNDLKNNTEMTSAKEIQKLFEESAEARYYLILFKNALNPFLEEFVFIAELERRLKKTGWPEKKESIKRLIIALEKNTGILSKDRNILMSEGKTRHVIAFFKENMPSDSDDLLSDVSGDISDHLYLSAQSIYPENSSLEPKHFHHRPSIDFEEDTNTVSESTTEEDNSDSSDDDREYIRSSRSLFLSKDFQKNEKPRLTSMHAILTEVPDEYDELISQPAKSKADVDANKLSALAYCYKKLRPRSSLFPLSPMMKETGLIEKIAMSYCVDLLSCNEKQAIIPSFLERCAMSNMAPYSILAIFNDREKLGLYAKTIEAVTAKSDMTFNAEMERYKSNPKAYKAQWKEKAAIENRQMSQSL